MKLQYRLVKKLKTSYKYVQKLCICIPQKVSEVTIPIANKYSKLKVKMKTSFCRNELLLTSEIL